MNGVKAKGRIDRARRGLLSGACALGAASLLALPRRAAAEPPPETRKIRLLASPAICQAPQAIVEQLIRLEGFSEITYTNADAEPGPALIAAGKADIGMGDIPVAIPLIDKAGSIVLLAGIHAGCYELFGNKSVGAIRDLKGKRVGVYAIGGGDHILLSSMLAYIGMDPGKDVEWVAGPRIMDAMRYFVEGTVDAFLGFPPQPQELRAKRIGRVIVNTAEDRPWSQYFCCAVAGNKEFVARYPVATKRALRAFLKAADICSREPERVARYLAANNIETRYEIGLEIVRSLPYDRWRQADPEDTMRFYALRLHEVGMINTPPQRLIQQGTQWRFLEELKTELKA